MQSTSKTLSYSSIVTDSETYIQGDITESGTFIININKRANSICVSKEVNLII